MRHCKAQCSELFRTKKKHDATFVAHFHRHLFPALPVCQRVTFQKAFPACINDMVEYMVHEKPRKCRGAKTNGFSFGCSCSLAVLYAPSATARKYLPHPVVGPAFEVLCSMVHDALSEQLLGYDACVRHVRCLLDLARGPGTADKVLLGCTGFSNGFLSTSGALGNEHADDNAAAFSAALTLRPKDGFLLEIHMPDGTKLQANLPESSEPPEIATMVAGRWALYNHRNALADGAEPLQHYAGERVTLIMYFDRRLLMPSRYSLQYR